MKTKISITLAALGSLLALGESAYAAENASSTTQRNESTGDLRAAENHRRGHMASDVIGRTVRASSGEKVGDIKDLLVDTQDGKVRLAVISSGGVLGVGDTLKAVPFSSLNYRSGQEDLTLQADFAKWQQAATIRDDQLQSLSRDNQGRGIYQHFGQAWDSAGQSSGSEPLRRASQIKGKYVVSGSQEVGDVEDVVINFRNQRASVLLDPNDNFTGTNEKFIVPFSKLSGGTADRETMTTSLNRSDFQRVAPPEQNWWDDNQGYLYRWMPNVAATDKRRSAADETIVENVRTLLNNDKSIADAAADVRVDSQGGRLILRGTVPSEDGRQRIEDKVEQAATGWTVDNQISVKGRQ